MAAALSADDKSSCNQNAAASVLNLSIMMHDIIAGRQFAEHLNYRIGIHSGPVVAGVIGLTKFAFDLWGDAVNLASRMVCSCVCRWHWCVHAAGSVSHGSLACACGSGICTRIEVLVLALESWHTSVHVRRCVRVPLACLGQANHGLRPGLLSTTQCHFGGGGASHTTHLPPLKRLGKIVPLADENVSLAPLAPLKSQQVRGGWTPPLKGALPAAPSPTWSSLRRPGSASVSR